MGCNAYGSSPDFGNDGVSSIMGRYGMSVSSEGFL